MSNDSLRITETFYSLQGESRTSGKPTYFIRLTGCPLRCQYCDSEYAFHNGERQQIADLVAQTQKIKAQHVCVTGGEPLAQPGCLDLLQALCDKGLRVSLETSGAMDVSAVDPRVDIVMDIKTPGSAESDKNLWSNLGVLGQKDQIKFVICSRSDYEWARFKVDEHSLNERVGEVLFSASYTELEASFLANWILEDNLPVRFQMQLHKLLWGDKPGV